VRVLALDTATAATAVGLVDTDKDLSRDARRVPPPGARPGHAAELLPLAEEVLAAAGLGWGDVDRIAAGTGPGSFTGLRIGLATARALALAGGAELVGVSTLRALAAAVEAEPEFRPEIVLAVLDARRGEAFAAAWEHGATALIEPAALAPEALAARVRALPGRPVGVGDGALAFRDLLEDAGTVIPDDASPLHLVQATVLARLGAEAVPGDPAAVLPDYLRAPDAKPRAA
jgi:tRNA threonylcarbamoyladenosine biosynthesis protein TsaB